MSICNGSLTLTGRTGRSTSGRLTPEGVVRGLVRVLLRDLRDLPTGDRESQRVVLVESPASPLGLGDKRSPAQAGRVSALPSPALPRSGATLPDSARLTSRVRRGWDSLAASAARYTHASAKPAPSANPRDRREEPRRDQSRMIPAHRWGRSATVVVGVPGSLVGELLLSTRSGASMAVQRSDGH